MQSSSSHALVLDFGGVISRTLFETHRETEVALGLPPDTLTWRGPFEPETDPLWQSMLRGEAGWRAVRLDVRDPRPAFEQARQLLAQPA